VNVRARQWSIKLAGVKRKRIDKWIDMA
jgi:hypothetical protein